MSVLCTYKFSLLSAIKGMIFVNYGVLVKNMGLESENLPLNGSVTLGMFLIFYETQFNSVK